MKRISIAFFAVLFILFGFTNNSHAVSTGNSKVNWLVERGLVTGYPDGTYGLDKPITRSEVAALLTRVEDKESTADLLKPFPGRFSDVFTNHWANGYINYASNLNYINGYPDNTFKPENNITYAEVIKILVMAKGDIPNLDEFEGSLWYIPYILKATENGILDNVVLPFGGYSYSASREIVFEMIYNTIEATVEEELESYKVIVTGNTRTMGIDSNELEVAVVRSKKTAGKQSQRYSENREFTINFNTHLDTEMYLGKVLDITIDREDTIVKFSVDETFGYYTGPFVVEPDYITLNTGDIFEVETSTRSRSETERLYSMYYNDRAYDYDRFLDKMDDYDGFNDDRYIVEFARITTKGDYVYFIDGFDFDDISPVVTVTGERRTIGVMDDKGNGSVKDIRLDSVFGYYDGKFVDLDIREIVPEDALHIYGNNAIVKMDGVYTGTYYGVDEYTGIYYAVISDQYFQIRNTSFKKPVYSLDGVQFATLIDTEAFDTLEDLEGRRVVFIIDLNGSLQMISKYY